MAGDRAEGVQTSPPAAESSSLFGHVMGGLKQLRDTTGSVVKHGVEKGEELAHSPTAKKIAGQVSDVAKEGLHKAQDVAHSPTTKRIAGQVVGAGEEVGRDHINKFKGAVAAGEHGDFNGVVRNGVPLATELLMPHAAAIAIVKDKGGKILMENVPAEHRDTAGKIKKAADLATSKPTLPNLILQGSDHVEHTERSGKY
ncbi:MAG: hypothetical protein HYX67_09895 [Candidatus Melainabacteria bacterium]|nr:hypothetical protein [Candidatus Melainabacteria bacterium]